MTVLSFRVLQGDCVEQLRTLEAERFQSCITSPPYWGLRDYGVAGQIGHEASPDAYVERLVEVFREVRRVLRPDGTLWLNLGDSYAAQAGGGRGQGGQCANRDVSLAGANKTRRKLGFGLKPKDLVGIPWRVAFALQADGWWLRSDIIWHKPNPMPESVEDRPTRSHEFLFLLSKSERYFYDAAAIREPSVEKSNGTAGRRLAAEGEGDRRNTHLGYAFAWEGETRNKRDVWTIPTTPCPEAHFAVFPEELVRPCVLAGSRPGDEVLDPFSGSGTTGMVALAQGRHFTGIELNPAYAAMARRRIGGVAPLLSREVA